MNGVQLLGKPTAIYHFAIQTNLQSSNSGNHVVTFTVT